MNTKAMGQPQTSLPMGLDAEDQQEREAIRELERMERALNQKKNGYKPRRRRAYADRG